jgi:two-component system sensor histidine kinase CpxA
VRRLYFRILAVSVLTLVVTFAGFLAVFADQNRRLFGGLLERLHTMSADEATAVLARDGTQATAAYLHRLDGAWGLTHALTDASGRDLVNGADRSAMLAAARQRLGRPTSFEGRMVLTHPSKDGRTFLLAWGFPPFSLRDVLPYYALILAAVGILSWLLAVGIVVPLKHTVAVVERFGKGDLAARTRTRRRDEIGDLGRAFDRTADRIETLLAAERRLLQDISHELRSPLTRLNLAIEILGETEGRQDAAARLRREADRLTALVSSLIEVTRAEGDPASRKVETVAVDALTREIVDTCTPELQARGVEVALAVDEPATVQGDHELLRRAVENVLRNAIRHAPAGTGIDVSCRSHADRVEVAIRDRGPGVPEEQLARLGEPFYRVDASRSAASGGVGLGLSIARRAIEVHHGTITSENARPGLRVTLTVPREA